MYPNSELLGAIGLLLWILFADGEATKKVVYNSIECSLRGKVFSKIYCQRTSRLSLNIDVTIGEQPADNIFGLCELTLTSKGQRKMRPLKGFKLDLCHLKRNSKTQSLLGSYYRALSRAAVNLPARCPFSKDTNILLRGLILDQEIPQYLPEVNYTFKGKFYANNELGLEVKVIGGFYINGSDSNL